MELTDAEIIAECLSGRTESFAELMTRYRRLVYNVIYNYTGTREDSDDLYQDVFIRIYQSLGTYDATCRFSAWAIRIAVNACFDWRKKRRDTGPIESAGEVGDAQARARGAIHRGRANRSGYWKQYRACRTCTGCRCSCFTSRGFPTGRLPMC